VSWQHDAAQRTRRWSKASRPAAVDAARRTGGNAGHRTTRPSQRRGGKGRGDAARLPARETLRRVVRHEEGKATGSVPALRPTSASIVVEGLAPPDPDSSGMGGTEPETGRRLVSGGAAWRNGRTDGPNRPTDRLGGNTGPRGRRRGPARCRGTLARVRTQRCAAANIVVRARNVADPMVGCRVQQTCKALRGENRRSREERQGRNEFGTWRPRTDG
jgi:hypothetical protein